MAQAQPAVMTEDEIRADERAKCAALLKRAAAGKREYADGAPAPQDGDRAIFGLSLSDAHKFIALTYEAAAALIEDPDSILLLIPAWQWTDAEHRAVLGLPPDAA